MESIKTIAIAFTILVLVSCGQPAPGGAAGAGVNTSPRQNAPTVEAPGTPGEGTEIVPGEDGPGSGDDE